MGMPSNPYKKLLRVIPDLLSIKEYRKLEAGGFMDLHVDILYKEGNKIRIAMAHNYIKNGDVCPDPDCELDVDIKAETVNMKTFQNIYIYSVVEDGDEKLQKELNEFLDLWLTNLIDQGHK